AVANHWRRPRCVNGLLDTTAWADRRVTTDAAEDVLSGQAADELKGGLALRTRAKYALAHGRVSQAGDFWHQQAERPTDPYELLLVALGCAAQGDAKALEYAEELRPWRPLDAEAVEIHYLWFAQRLDEAMPRLEKLLQDWQQCPWVSDMLVRGTLQLIEKTQF